MPISLYLSNKVLAHAFGSGAAFAAQSAFFSLHTGNPSPTGAGEITAASYSRATAPNNSTVWLTGGNQSAWNVLTLNFSTPTAAWPTATYMGIWDNSTAGNMLAYGQLQAATAAASGNIVSFPSGSITISLV